MRGITHILVTLPPEETGDLVFFRIRVVCIEIGKDLLRAFDIVVILFACIPCTLDFFTIALGIIWSPAVSRIHFSAVLIRFTAWREEIPT